MITQNRGPEIKYLGVQLRTKYAQHSQLKALKRSK